MSFKALLQAAPTTPVDDVMRPWPKRLRPDAGFGEIARLVTDFDLLAAPVVDDEQRLLGTIIADDVLEVIMPEDWRRRPRSEEN